MRAASVVARRRVFSLAMLALAALACSDPTPPSAAQPAVLKRDLATLAIESEAAAYERATLRIHAANWERELADVARELESDALAQGSGE